MSAAYGEADRFGGTSGAVDNRKLERVVVAGIRKSLGEVLRAIHAESVRALLVGTVQ